MTATRAPEASPEGRARRGLLAWLVLGVAGAVLALASSGRTWATITLGGGAGAARTPPVPLTGGEIAPVLSPLALAALAAVVAVLATRGPWRGLVGAVLGLIGLALAGAVAGGAASSSRLVSLAEERTTVTGADVAAVAHAWAWPVAAAAGGVMLLAAGVLAVARGARWPGMSERYDRPGGASGEDGRPAAGREGRAGRSAERSLWDALDRGVDPTDGDADGRDRRV
ncbi:TIGR02234 family membrane protein [Sphaerisporangium album]|uniref:TIGR02234 family membrane protein n=1 Tax=Sphaerisporangium album TaxID=509200 RepID=A0A367FTL5_9ACTN|nr:TIGR02234 family membrane protein [Sphaerisporangium album]RCG33037.1 TIGR02234 family membrane protein [Sphaerisporangium album]